jgi:hypothetical protein
VLAIAGLYIWSKWLKDKYNAWRIEREEREYDARYHKSKLHFNGMFANSYPSILPY